MPVDNGTRSRHYAYRCLSRTLVRASKTLETPPPPSRPCVRSRKSILHVLIILTCQFTLSIMPAIVARPPAKRVLMETTNTRSNVMPSPQSAKKRKLDSSPVKSLKYKPKGPNSSNPGSSQPKSHFEEEVLEKLTQDINGLRKNNSEKDQQWARPPLGDFDERTHELCFQQIEAEEGTLHGGRTTVKLFGVTEASSQSVGLFT